jgi:hypothetical protein
MNFIGKHISLIGILLLSIFVGAAAGLYFDLPARFQKSSPAVSAKEIFATYTCPMHHDVVQSHPGNCPKCGMALIQASQAQPGQAGCNDGDQHSCCARPEASKGALPPGHPPVDGYGCPAHIETDQADANSSK